MWETIEAIMKRKGVETEKKLELQVELDEDWEWVIGEWYESFIMSHGKGFHAPKENFQNFL